MTAHKLLQLNTTSALPKPRVLTHVISLVCWDIWHHSVTHPKSFLLPSSCSRCTGAYHQTEVEDATDDVKAGVLEAEEVQILAAQLHAAGGGGVGRHAVVLPTPP